MLKYFSIVISLMVVLLACKNNTKAANEIANTADTTQRFPIIELIQNDADDAINTPYFIYQKTTDLTTKKVDSIALDRNRAEFKKIIEPIIKINLNTKEAKENFKETSFHDLSTKSYSVVIASLKANSGLQSITALFNDETNKLRNALIVMESTNNDTVYTKKYFWKTGKSLSIATSVSYQNKIVKETSQFINWNDRDLQ